MKCQLTLNPQSATVDANGGTAGVAVTVDPECPWSASTATPWITITPPGSGQGSGRAEFRVAANSGAAARHGDLAINSQHVSVDQSGCTFSLSQTTQAFGAGGGSASVSVTGGSACSWTAVSNADWVVITSGASGTGAGTVSFAAGPNAGSARSGTLTIAGQPFTVMQAAQQQSCAATIAPTSQNVGSSGGSGTVTVTAGADCAWTAVSNAPWITINSGASGTGNGTVTFTVASTTTARTGTLTVAGQAFTVNQTAGGTCSYSLNPTVQNVPQGGGSTFVDITAVGPSCQWNVVSNAPWITASGSGIGNYRLTMPVAANPGQQARSGTVTIAGLTFTVNQAACAYGINPTSVNVGSAAGAGPSVAITNAQGCTWQWSTSSNAAWLTQVLPPLGTGPANVTYNVLANTAPPRSGTLTIAGLTFTVNQADGCTITLSPTSPQSVPKTAGTGTVTITGSNSACGWGASSVTSGGTWLSITSGGGPGMGTGTLTFSFQANPGVARTGTLSIAGQTYTINQAAGP